MEDPALTSIRDLILQALYDCTDPELLDLVYKLLCFL